MKSFSLAVILSACLSVSGIAQTTFVGCVNNPTVPVGTPVTITLNAGVPGGLFSGCGIDEVRLGSPTGTVVYSPFFCPAIFINVGPGTNTVVTWSQLDAFGVQVAPGEYYMRVAWGANTGGPSVIKWFPVRIEDPANPLPTMSITSPRTPGSTVSVNINHPGSNLPATYIAAASFGTETGFDPAPSLHVALDQDVLFNLTFPLVDPGLASIFQNFSGATDAAGNATATFNIPNDPGLIGIPFCFQAGMFDSLGNFSLTNATVCEIR